jgi:hypothetical protein
VKYFGHENLLHTIWDTNLVESAHKWGYTEWQQQIDRVCLNGIKEITAGTIDDWAKETVNICTDVYKAMPEGASVSYNEVATWSPIIEQQLLRGGLRLAYLLNSIFDK